MKVTALRSRDTKSVNSEADEETKVGENPADDSNIVNSEADEETKVAEKPVDVEVSTNASNRPEVETCDLSETQSHCFALHVTPEPVCSHQVFEQYGWIGLGEAESLYRIRGVYRVIFNDETEGWRESAKAGLRRR
ncbi:hypothetical protein PsorP6_003912 [Peronosclerospora sorghi]|uniref:Uncharacterized protein n=1 Tax=Peronosclerospora sorghi TaxID=230839 RepID=A0ACC0VL37_9STRA|nr:hypothetical protein PsorP6_003912 [Peronosclerospora sorghi]